MTKTNCQREFERWSKDKGRSLEVYDYYPSGEARYLESDTTLAWAAFRAGFEVAKKENKNAAE